MNPAVDVTSSISPALRAMLAGTVDYAGLFPPAGLPLAEALENYASYLSNGETWMLGCFVLPTARMAEAGPLVTDRFGPGNMLRISALVAKATPLTFLTNLTTNLQDLSHFREKNSPSVSVDQLEAPLPSPVVTADLCALLKRAAEVIETHAPGPLAVFWEVPFSEDLPAVLTEMSAFNEDAAHPFAVKLRTGGLSAEAFPTSGQLAGALVAARDCGVALKFTAGLHHPVRHFDPGVQTHMHGFLNVFAAGILAHAQGLGVEDVRVILDEEDPGNFRFTDDVFTWRDLTVNTGTLVKCRRFLTSFGSCSFDEPRDDLRQLGLLS